MVAQTAVHPPDRNGPRFGLRTRMLAGYLVLVAVLVGAISFTALQIFSQRLVSGLNTDLLEEVPEYTNALAGKPPGQAIEAFTANYLVTHVRKPTHELLISIVGPSGPGSAPAVLTTPGADALRVLPAVAAALDHPPPAPVTTTTRVQPGGDTRIILSPVVSNGAVIGTLVSTASLAGVNTDRSELIVIVLLVGGGAVLVAAGGGYLLVRRVLGAVAQLTSTARDVSRQDLSGRIAYHGVDDELGELARTFDEMLDRLDRAFQAQNRLLADVSHQLRTPLTVVRGHLEVLDRGRAHGDEVSETVATVVDELDRIGFLIDRLLLLGHALEPDFVEAQLVALPDLLDDVFDAARMLAERHWEHGAVPPVVVRVDLDKLRGALLNLVDNAVRATGETDTIRIDARVQDAGGEIVLQVSDTGRGIPSDQQAAVFERFVRSSNGYRGSGLGLALVQAVARSHGGRAELDSEPGTGTRVRIVLPASRLAATAPAEVP